MGNPEEIGSAPCSSCGLIVDKDELNNSDWDYSGVCSYCTPEDNTKEEKNDN